MNHELLKKFFYNWEVLYRNGECMSKEEYQKMTAEQVAEINAACFEKYLEEENPL